MFVLRAENVHIMQLCVSQTLKAGCKPAKRDGAMVTLAGTSIQNIIQNKIKIRSILSEVINLILLRVEGKFGNMIQVHQRNIIYCLHVS